MALFELNVLPQRFLEDKIRITGWMIHKLKMIHFIDFDVNDVYCPKFLNFLRVSPLISGLYEEDTYNTTGRSSSFTEFSMHGRIWNSIHMGAAIIFIACVTLAVILHDNNEQKVGWITSSFFLCFCLLGYCTGTNCYCGCIVTIDVVIIIITIVHVLLSHLNWPFHVVF